MSVYFVTGSLGGGKTLMSVNRIKDYLMRGCPVATNLDIRLHHMLKRTVKDVTLFRLPDKPAVTDFEIIGKGNTTYEESKNGLIVLDECGTWFNSRSWADKERQKIINWFLHARKLGWDIIFIVQNIAIVDKQARLALGEHVVYCKRTDRLNIPVIGTIFKLFWGGKMPLPRVHIGVVKYGLLPHSLTVDTWMNTGSALFNCYDTKQVFSDLYSNGVFSLLSPWVTHGRYAVKRTWNFYMRLTKIYARKYSRLTLFVLGAFLTLFITEAVANKSKSPDIDRKIHWSALDQGAAAPAGWGILHPKPDKDQEIDTLSLKMDQDFEWVKVNSYSAKGKIRILHNGVYSLKEFPHRLKYEGGWFYAHLPVSKSEDS